MRALMHSLRPTAALRRLGLRLTFVALLAAALMPTFARVLQPVGLADRAAICQATPPAAPQGEQHEHGDACAFCSLAHTTPVLGGAAAGRRPAGLRAAGTVPRPRPFPPRSRKRAHRERARLRRRLNVFANVRHDGHARVAGIASAVAVARSTSNPGSEPGRWRDREHPTRGRAERETDSTRLSRTRPSRIPRSLRP